MTGTYDPREYCVQYRETDFNFVSRLMEQHGIFYFFQHENGKHTMVVARLPHCPPGLPGPGEGALQCKRRRTQSEDVITSFEIEQELRTGKYSLTDYNFETPSTSLLAGEPTVVASARTALTRSMTIPAISESDPGWSFDQDLYAGGRSES